MFFTRAHVLSLEAQIADLKQRLDASERERSTLLDRLLAKNNIEPTSAQPLVRSDTTLRVLSPSTASTPDEQAAYETSWMDEEIRYQMMQHGYSEDRAREIARVNYVEFHKPIL